jgi:paired amphipathic helix protein Sin3a
MQKDETTFDLDDMERKERWQYYTSSYVRIEPTEGVPRGRIQRSVLPRNLPSGDTESEDGSQRKALEYREDLTLRVCVNSFKILFKPGGTEYFIYGDKPLTFDKEKNAASARVRLQKYEDSRNERFREKFVMNSKWMKGLPHDEVQKITLDTKKWIEEGVIPGTAPAAPVEPVA